MKVRNHQLVQDGGTAIPYQASPNKGGALQARWLVMHYTAGRSAESSAALNVRGGPGTEYPALPGSPRAGAGTERPVVEGRCAG